MSPEAIVFDQVPLATKVLSNSTLATFETEDSSSTSLISDELDLNSEKSLKATLNVIDSPVSAYNTRPWIVGHRGCLYQELENTREGFQKCAEMGIDAVEMDVFLLKCGSLVVFHGGGTDENPGDLLDYCGVEGSILDLTYEEALQLQFNPDYAEFGCPADVTLRGSIPTLEDVLNDAQKSGLHLKIELKGKGTVEPTLELVERLNMVDQCSYSSFDLDMLSHLRALRPNRDVYKTGALFDERPDDFIEQAKRAGATEIHLRYDTCTLDAVSQIHKAGFGSMNWIRGPVGMARDCQEKFIDVGNEDESMYDAMLRTGVQQLCINRPDVLLGLRRKLNPQSIQSLEPDLFNIQALA